jgi:hypothetical protein
MPVRTNIAHSTPICRREEMLGAIHRFLEGVQASPQVAQVPLLPTLAKRILNFGARQFLVKTSDRCRVPGRDSAELFAENVDRLAPFG